MRCKGCHHELSMENSYALPVMCRHHHGFLDEATYRVLGGRCSFIDGSACAQCNSPYFLCAKPSGILFLQCSRCRYIPRDIPSNKYAGEFLKLVQGRLIPLKSRLCNEKLPSRPLFCRNCVDQALHAIPPLALPQLAAKLGYSLSDLTLLLSHYRILVEEPLPPSPTPSPSKAKLPSPKPSRQKNRPASLSSSPLRSSPRPPTSTSPPATMLELSPETLQTFRSIVSETMARYWDRIAQIPAPRTPQVDLSAVQSKLDALLNRPSAVQPDPPSQTSPPPPSPPSPIDLTAIQTMLSESIRVQERARIEAFVLITKGVCELLDQALLRFQISGVIAKLQEVVLLGEKIGLPAAELQPLRTWQQDLMRVAFDRALTDTEGDALEVTVQHLQGAIQRFALM